MGARSRTATACQAYGVSKVYGRRDTAVHALRDVTLHIPECAFTAIMGPSGSGKSTLLHCLAALDTPTAGHVYLGRTELTALSRRQQAQVRRDRIGFVFQAFNLVPTLDAIENITLPQLLAGRRPDREWLNYVVAQVGLGDRLRHRPSELSGGQQQRVALARALAGRPEVIFADEPTGNLDTTASREMLGLLRDAVHEFDQTVVTVTHDPSIAAYADQVLFLSDGQVVDQAQRPDVEQVLERLRYLDAGGAGRNGHGGLERSARPELHASPQPDRQHIMRSRRRRQPDETTPGRPMVGTDDEVEVARQERWLQRIREQFELEQESARHQREQARAQADDWYTQPSTPQDPSLDDDGWLPPERSWMASAGRNGSDDLPPERFDPAPADTTPWSAPEVVPEPWNTRRAAADPWERADTQPAPATADPWDRANTQPPPATADPWDRANTQPAPATADHWETGDRWADHHLDAYRNADEQAADPYRPRVYQPPHDADEPGEREPESTGGWEPRTTQPRERERWDTDARAATDADLDVHHADSARNGMWPPDRSPTNNGDRYAEDDHTTPDADPWRNAWDANAGVDVAEVWSPAFDRSWPAYEEDVPAAETAQGQPDTPAPDVRAEPLRDEPVAEPRRDEPVNDVDTDPAGGWERSDAPAGPPPAPPVESPTPPPTAARSTPPVPPSPSGSPERAPSPQPQAPPSPSPRPAPPAPSPQPGPTAGAQREEQEVPPALASLRNPRRQDDPLAALQSLQAQLDRLNAAGRATRATHRRRGPSGNDPGRNGRH